MERVFISELKTWNKLYRTNFDCFTKKNITTLNIGNQSWVLKLKLPACYDLDERLIKILNAVFVNISKRILNIRFIIQVFSSKNIELYKIE